MDFYAIYLRKSRQDAELEKLGQGETLSRHRVTLLEVAKNQKLNIVKIYEEVVSGDSIASRPQMQALLSAVEQGEYSGVLVMEIERLARGDSIDQGIVAQTFKATGTKIITPYKTYDPNSDIDEEYFEFGLFMARREYKTIKRRLYQGRIQSAKEGKWLSRAPYGYRRVKLDGQKGYTLEPYEEEAVIIRMIFEMYVYGIELETGERRRLGIQAIAGRLNQLGIPASRRDRWTKPTIRDILNNPAYKGYVRWGYRKCKPVYIDGKKAEKRPISLDNDCIITKGLHKAIVPEELYDKAQEYAELRPVMPVGYKSEVKNPLAGIVKCAVCGHRMTWRNGTDRKPPYLVCKGHNCYNVSSPVPLVEKRVLDILEFWIRDYRVQLSRNSQQIQMANNNSLLETARKQQETYLARLQKQLEATYDLLEQGVYTVEQFTERTKNIGDRIEEIKVKIKTIQTEIEQLKQKEQRTAIFIPNVIKVLDLYRQLNTAAEKNKLLKEVIKEVVYYKEKSGSYSGVSPDDFTIEVFPLLPDACI